MCVCVAKLIRELFTEQLKSMQHSLPVLCIHFIYIHCSIFCICWHNFQPQWEKLIWPSSQWGALSAEAEPQGVANVQNCNINTLALTSQQQQQQVFFLLQLLLFNFHWFLLLWLHRAHTHTHTHTAYAYWPWITNGNAIRAVVAFPVRSAPASSLP